MYWWLIIEDVVSEVERDSDYRSEMLIRLCLNIPWITYHMRGGREETYNNQIKVDIKDHVGRRGCVCRIK